MVCLWEILLETEMEENRSLTDNQQSPTLLRRGLRYDWKIKESILR